VSGKVRTYYAAKSLIGNNHLNAPCPNTWMHIGPNQPNCNCSYNSSWEHASYTKWIPRKRQPPRRAKRQPAHQERHKVVFAALTWINSNLMAIFEWNLDSELNDPANANFCNAFQPANVFWKLPIRYPWGLTARFPDVSCRSTRITLIAFKDQSFLTAESPLKTSGNSVKRYSKTEIGSQFF